MKQRVTNHLSIYILCVYIQADQEYLERNASCWSIGRVEGWGIANRGHPYLKSRTGWRHHFIYLSFSVEDCLR